MTPPDTSGAERQRWLCRAIVQEGRAAATRGLLHDFSNVMVGLCSISENAVEDVPEDNPLHDDLAIIRDSSMRAYQLIRRIVQLNAVDPGEPDLIECRSWMAGALESLRAVLPKGSSVTVDESSPVLFLRTREDALRDAFLVLSLAAARRHRARVSLTLAVRKGAGQVGFTVTDRALDAGSSPQAASLSSAAEDLPPDFAECCAQKLGGTWNIEDTADGARRVTMLIPAEG